MTSTTTEPTAVRFSLSSSIEAGSLPPLLVEAVQAQNVELAQLLLQGNDGQAVHARDEDGQTLLHHCAQSLDVDFSRGFQTLDLLLRCGAFADTRNEIGESPLILAIRAVARSTSIEDDAVDFPRLDVVTRLLQARASANMVVEATGETPLMEAIREDDTHLCRLLMRYDADPDQEGLNGATAMDLARTSGFELPDIRQTETERDAYIHHVHKKATALQSLEHLSVQSLEQRSRIAGLHESCLHFAVRAAIVSLRGTPSWHTADSPQLDIVRSLLERRADVNAVDAHGETSLMEAACVESNCLCRLLLDFKADVHIQSHSGLSAADYLPLGADAGLRRLLGFSKLASERVATAARKLDAEDLQCLLSICSVDEVRAMTQQRCDQDQTLLHLVAQTLPTSANESALMATMRELLDHSANVDAVNFLGETPLLRAVQAAVSSDCIFTGSRLGAVSLLLACRADPNATDNVLQETPLMTAACDNDHALSRLLISWGADPQQRSGAGLLAENFVCNDDADLLALLRCVDRECNSTLASESEHTVLEETTTASLSGSESHGASKDDCEDYALQGTHGVSSTRYTDSTSSNENDKKDEFVQQCFDTDLEELNLRERISALQKDLEAAQDHASKAEQTLENVKQEQSRLVVEMKQREESLREALALAEQETSRLKEEATRAEREWLEICERVDDRSSPLTSPRIEAHYVGETDSAEAQKKVDNLMETGCANKQMLLKQLPPKLLEAVTQADPSKVRSIFRTAEPGTCTEWCTLRDTGGCTLLHLVAMAPPSDKSFAVVGLLLRWGAQVDAKNNLGETPLCLAVHSALHNDHDFEVASWMRPTKLLLERRADVNISSGFTCDGETLLAKALKAGKQYADMTSLLIDHGAQAKAGVSIDSLFEEQLDMRGATAEGEVRRPQADFEPEDTSVLLETARTPTPSATESNYPSLNKSSRIENLNLNSARESNYPSLNKSSRIENLNANPIKGSAYASANKEMKPPVAKAKQISRIGSFQVGGNAMRPPPKEASTSFKETPLKPPVKEAPTPLSKASGRRKASDSSSQGSAADAKTAPSQKKGEFPQSSGSGSGYFNHGTGFTPQRSTSTTPYPKAKRKVGAKKQQFGRQDDDKTESYTSFGHDPAKLPPRIRKYCMQFPGYAGELPPVEEAEELWTDQELHNFFFSSGFIKPGCKKKKKPTKVLPPAVLAERLRTLGLNGKAGIELVRKTYRKLALKCHPDKNPDVNDATEFQEICEAYEAICSHFRELQEKSA